MDFVLQFRALLSLCHFLLLLERQRGLVYFLSLPWAQRVRSANLCLVLQVVNLELMKQRHNKSEKGRQLPLRLSALAIWLWWMTLAENSSAKCL